MIVVVVIRCMKVKESKVSRMYYLLSLWFLFFSYSLRLVL